MASMKWHNDVKRWRVFWYMTLPDGTINKGSKAFKKKDEAEQFKEKCEQEAETFKTQTWMSSKLPLEEMVKEWREYIKRHTEFTQFGYNICMDKFLEALPKNIALITDIKNAHINSFLNSLREKGDKNATINRYMTIIKSLFKFANQYYQVPDVSLGIKKLKEDPYMVDFLREDQYQEVLKTCDTRIKPWIMFLANTGLRTSEFCNLKWCNYDRIAKCITIVGKGRKKRTVPLNQTCLEVLNEIEKVNRRHAPDDYVFMSLRGRHGITRNMVHSHVSKAFKKVGVNGGGCPCIFERLFILI
ncbi:MAG: hypothetical protein A2Y10_01325 [Planctomycetes bacterium GWF2_41_51]|nr:MAG: hypothetical protein A2Y10_01325 [Planctomycetes bacterium GWF2_41_51]HBG26732.1 hypothetical protein [Phycisphaerales bacterium]